ncbi:MAG: hypothetical protein KGJ23_02370 [Euryarchaeota archaeon]|nr:hypothetical protein [Euryarchaeota archaeon]MDE1879577.1 hypothetical protein [Euryarchaeota archaeon]MDE2046092.1 hypothetical protein [Thermoplasmata archaeon]
MSAHPRARLVAGLLLVLGVIGWVVGWVLATVLSSTSLSTPWVWAFRSGHPELSVLASAVVAVLGAVLAYSAGKVVGRQTAELEFSSAIQVSRRLGTP